MNSSVLDFISNISSQACEEPTSPPDTSRLLPVAVGFIWVVLIGLTLFFLGRLFLMQNWAQAVDIFHTTITSTPFLHAVLIGFLAQVVDGALGMAYGVTATTFLLSTGVSPALASAGVHMAEIFTTGFSGLSHVHLGNVHKPLFARLVVPGVFGSIVGAVVVTQLDGTFLKPYISAYLLLMGIYILGKTLWRQQKRVTQPPKHVAKLALFGGFVDAVGGGGWGPVVTSTLVGSGNDPRTTIGSVNFAEFFLALASAASFSMLAQTNMWPLVAGLVLGGVGAAPCAAFVCKYLRPRILLFMVGTLISLLSLYNLYRALS